MDAKRRPAANGRRFTRIGTGTDGRDELPLIWRSEQILSIAAKERKERKEKRTQDPVTDLFSAIYALFAAILIFVLVAFIRSLSAVGLAEEDPFAVLFVPLWLFLYSPTGG